LVLYLPTIFWRIYEFDNGSINLWSIDGWGVAEAAPGTLTTTSNLRSTPSLKANVLEVLPSGGYVEVLNITTSDTGNYWFYVQPKVEGTPSGWVSSDLVRFQLENKRYATIAGSRGYRANVRSSPNLGSKLLYNALSGDLVTIIGSDKGAGLNRWYCIKFPSGLTGWVRGDLLSIWQEGCVITCPVH
jgi:uncharacterized protein YgiM (DUF1202 family)